MDIEQFLNERLRKLEQVYEDSLANNNYTFALNIHIRIDEIKELLYLLKNEKDIRGNNEEQED